MIHEGYRDDKAIRIAFRKNKLTLEGWHQDNSDDSEQDSDGDDTNNNDDGDNDDNGDYDDEVENGLTEEGSKEDESQ